MQGENERQWKKVNENTYDISSIKSVTIRSFWKFDVVVVENNDKEMYKKVYCTRTVGFFAN